MARFRTSDSAATKFDSRMSGFAWTAWTSPLAWRRVAWISLLSCSCSGFFAKASGMTHFRSKRPGGSCLFLDRAAVLGNMWGSLSFEPLVSFAFGLQVLVSFFGRAHALGK